MENNLVSFTGLPPDASVTELGHLDASIGSSDTRYSDAVHLSNAHDWRIHADSIVGGAEDCVDIQNRSDTINISVDKFFSGGSYVCTVKGGSSNVTITGVIYAHGREVDIDIGNWSDQSSAITHNVTLNLCTVDGSPVTYRVLNGTRPTFYQGLSSGPYKCKFALPSFLIGPVWFVWGLLKKLGLA